MVAVPSPEPAFDLPAGLPTGLASLPDPAAWAANVLVLCVGVPLVAESAVRLMGRTLGAETPRLAQQIRRATLLVCLLAPGLALLSAWPTVQTESRAGGDGNRNAAAILEITGQQSDTARGAVSTPDHGCPTPNDRLSTFIDRLPSAAFTIPTAKLPGELGGVGMVLALLLGASMICGLALGGTALLRQGIRLRRLCEAAEPARPEQLPADWPGLVSRAGLRSPPEVRFWPAVATPMAFGVWTATILLPAELADRRYRTQLAGVLAHELAHLAGRDPLWNWVAGLACSVCWWQPTVRVTAAALRSDSEFVADETAVHSVGDGLPLADYLATLAERLCRGTAQHAYAETAEVTAELNPASGMADRVFRSELGRRVGRLLEFTEQDRPASWPVRCGRWLNRRGTGWLALPLAAGLTLVCPQWLGRASTLATAEDTNTASTDAASTYARADGSVSVLSAGWAMELGLSYGERRALLAEPVPVRWPAESVTQPKRSELLPGRLVPGSPDAVSDMMVVRVVRLGRLKPAAALGFLQADPLVAEAGEQLRLVADDELSVIALRGPARLVLPLEALLRQQEARAGPVEPARPCVELIRLVRLHPNEAARRLRELPGGPVAGGIVRVVARPNSSSLIVDGPAAELGTVVAQLRKWDTSEPPPRPR